MLSYKPYKATNTICKIPCSANTQYIISTSHFTTLPFVIGDNICVQPFYPNSEYQCNFNWNGTTLEVILPWKSYTLWVCYERITSPLVKTMKKVYLDPSTITEVQLSNNSYVIYTKFDWSTFHLNLNNPGNISTSMYVTLFYGGTRSTTGVVNYLTAKFYPVKQTGSQYYIDVIEGVEVFISEV